MTKNFVQNKKKTVALVHAVWYNSINKSILVCINWAS